MQIFLLEFLHSGRVATENILKPADRFHATLARGRKNCLQHIVVTKFGGTKILQWRV
jgi:hypothetical protein